MHVHVVAVSGTGMGSLAVLLSALGHEVSGSDLRFDPPMGQVLRDANIRLYRGFDSAHLSPTPDLVVVGNVCRKDNPEAVAAFERGLRVTHIAGALRELVLDGTSPLVVTGTHGKTTTTALTAFLLDSVGKRPGFLVGGVPVDFGQSARPAALTEPPLPLAGALRRRTPFVLEGDEYDTAYFEKTPKFLHYGAEVAIVTSIEHDHVDIYPSFDAYQDAFARFVASIPESGLIVAHAADPNVVEVVTRYARAPVTYFGIADELTTVAAHWTAAPLPGGPEGTSFDLFAGGVAAGRFHLSMSGRHNLRNALAALAAAIEGYGVPSHSLRPALAKFGGVMRRQQLLGEPGGIFVIDDFAHHPTAVHQTLLALRQRYPGGALRAVFEPRSATACRRLHQEQYARAFDAADAVYLAPLGRVLDLDQALDLDRLAADLRAKGQIAVAYPSIEAIVSALGAEAQRGDCIALLSNGTFGGIHETLLAALAD